jgi:pimeloyl-ACP methyl ester carboxylesterase
MFAARYGRSVAGIVFEDPTDLRELAEEVTYYREQGYVGQAMLDRKAALLSFRNMTEGAKVLVATVQGDFKEFRNLPPLPDVPVAMLMSAHFDPVSWKGSPCAPKECEEVLVRWRIHWLRAMMRGVSDATLTVSTSVGHFMHVEDPELVVTSIRRVFTSAGQRGAP